MTVRWKFFDPIANVTYTVPINPSAYSEAAFTKTLTYQSTSAADGSTLMFEGRDAVQEISFTGVALEQTHIDALISWWALRHQVKMTDDFGNELWIYLTSITRTRKRSITYPHKRDYEMKAVILDVTG